MNTSPPSSGKEDPTIGLRLPDLPSTATVRLVMSAGKIGRVTQSEPIHLSEVIQSAGLKLVVGFHPTDDFNQLVLQLALAWNTCEMLGLDLFPLMSTATGPEMDHLLRRSEIDRIWLPSLELAHALGMNTRKPGILSNDALLVARGMVTRVSRTRDYPSQCHDLSFVETALLISTEPMVREGDPENPLFV